MWSGPTESHYPSSRSQMPLLPGSLPELIGQPHMEFPELCLLYYFVLRLAVPTRLVLSFSWIWSTLKWMPCLLPPECQLFEGRGFTLFTAVFPASAGCLQMCTELSEVGQGGDGSSLSSALELLTQTLHLSASVPS